VDDRFIAASRVLERQHRFRWMAGLATARLGITLREGTVMDTYQVGYFVGSLSSTFINRVLAQALI
jgi:hypothetical protein